MINAEAESTTFETDDLILKALKKVGGIKEKDLCRYLPSKKGGYMHHFTLKKIKTRNPKEIHSLIQEFILSPQSPCLIDPKPRVRRKKALSLNQLDLKLILKLAQKTGDKYLLAKLGAKLPISSIKKELVKSIKEHRVEADLWNSYKHVMDSQKTISED